jgi:holo-[acyl-carrier protein] synthase
MILGVGIDSVSVKRIENLMLHFEKKFPQKLFVINEVLRANQINASPKNFVLRALFYAKRFAAKEAFAKATGLGIGRGINFKDIEIANDASGKPHIKILNDKDSFLKKHFNCKKFAVHLSLTDESDLASAFVVIEKIS